MRQISKLTCYDHSILSNGSFKIDLNAKSFNMFCECCSSCAKCGNAVSVSTTTFKGDVNSALRENSKNPHHQQYQQKDHLTMTVIEKHLF